MTDLFHWLYDAVLLALFGIPLFVIYTLRHEIEELIRTGAHRFVESRRKAALQAKKEAGPDAEPREVEKKMGFVTRIIHRISGDSNYEPVAATPAGAQKAVVEASQAVVLSRTTNERMEAVPNGGADQTEALVSEVDPALVAPDLHGQRGMVTVRLADGAEVPKLEARVIELLRQAPLSKPELAVKLGQKSPSSALKLTLRTLLERGLVEYTIPGSPSSRGQKYRLKDTPKPVAPTAEIS